MRSGTRHLSWLALLSGAALLSPAFAQGQGTSPPASFVAVDEGDSPRFAANGGAGTSVSIAAGESVGFSYPTGNDFHNVRFGPAQPSSCTQTGGAPVGPVPPLPAEVQGPGWTGTCTFAGAGRYAFVCDAHAQMTGTVDVSAAAPTPAPAASASPAPASQAMPAPSPSGPAASAPAVARTQRGRSVRGAVQIARAGSRLQVDVLAKRAAVRGKGKGLVRVGRVVRAPAGGRRVAFAVPLSASATKALRRAGRLTLTVRIVVAPASGAPFSATKAVTLRR